MSCLLAAQYHQTHADTSIHTRDLLALLESLPPGPVYATIATLAAVENIFPPVPADISVALGAFLAGRGRLDPWLVFALTWLANTGAGAAVYAFSRRYGRAFFTGRLGRRLLPEAVLARIELAYARHGVWGIFLSRMLPVWRGVVMPFAGIAGVGAWRALVPLAAASAVYYGLIIYLVTQLGTNVDAVLAAVGRLNLVLGVLAIGLAVMLTVLVVRRKREP